MITDTNASLGNWPFRKMRYNDPDSLAERLGRVGIGRAWVVSLDAVFLRDCHTANEPLAQAVADHEALMPVATINPNFPSWQRDLAECVQTLGYRGIRAYPNYHQYTLHDPVFEELLAAAEELGVFLSLAVRMTDERHHYALCMVPPVDLTPLPDLAAKHPTFPILVVNANNADVAPFCRSAPSRVGPTLLSGPCRSALQSATSPNLYFDLSHFEGVAGVEKLAPQLGIERIVFGTHAPYYYPESAMMKVRQECEFTEEELEAILHGNAERMLRGHWR